MMIVTGWMLENMAAEPTAMNEEPYIAGEIVSLAENKLLVAEGIEGKYDEDMENLVGKAIWLTVIEETVLTGIQGEEIAFEDISVGQNIEAWVIGLILESYPAQGTAAKITLVEDMLEAKVFFYMLEEDGSEVIVAASREFPVPQDIKAYVISKLLEGPTDQEREKGYFTGIYEETTLNSVHIKNGVAYIDFKNLYDACKPAAREQIVKTLLQFPQVDDVKIIYGKE